jgi:hypothetical protein
MPDFRIFKVIALDAFLILLKQNLEEGSNDSVYQMGSERYEIRMCDN